MHTPLALLFLLGKKLADLPVSECAMYTVVYEKSNLEIYPSEKCPVGLPLICKFSLDQASLGFSDDEWIEIFERVLTCTSEKTDVSVIRKLSQSKKPTASSTSCSSKKEPKSNSGGASATIPSQSLFSKPDCESEKP